MPRLATQTKKNTTQGKGSGKRRRFRGRMVGSDGRPRSHHIDKLTAPMTYTVGDTAMSARPTRARELGPYRTTGPTKRHHRRGFYRSIEEATT